LQPSNNYTMNTSSNSDITALAFTTALETCTEDTNICGLPCPGSCQTCVQSNADLNAFYGVAATATAAVAVAEPIEVAVMMPAGDEEFDEQVRNDRTLDEVEASRRNGEWADQDDDEEYQGDCDCRECRDGYVPENWFNDRRDNDYYDDRETGLDWNEGGYFD
jgi:hypothetical protein